jgi:tail tube protein
MAAAKGFASVAAFKKATTWGTPVAAGAGDGIEFASESLTPDAQFIPDEQINGKATKLAGDKGNEFHSGDLEVDAKYQGVEVLLAMAMGTAGVPTQVLTDDAYLHVFKPADNKEGIFGTLVFNKQVGVWEYTTAKVGGFTLGCTNGERAKLTFPIIPQGLNINTGAGTNNNTTVANITLPTNRDFLLFSQMKVRINDTSGGALAAADEVYVSEFECTLNNNFPTDDVTTQYGYLIDEPIQDGFTELSGSLNFSKYNNNNGGNTALLTALLSKTPKKMSVVWTGRLASGTTNFRMTMYFPSVQFSSGDANIGGPERIPLNLQWMASRVLTLPTGFPAGYTDALTIELVNQRNSNPLV